LNVHCQNIHVFILASQMYFSQRKTIENLYNNNDDDDT